MSSPGRKYHPLAELIRARLLEFLREPEVMFWVFVFPIAMALALGFAFRDKAPEAVPVGITGKAQTDLLRQARAQSPLFKCPDVLLCRPREGPSPDWQDRPARRERLAAGVLVRPDPSRLPDGPVRGQRRR